MNKSEFASLVSDVFKSSFKEIMANYQCDVCECADCEGVMEFSSTVSIDAGAKDFEMYIGLKMPYASLERSIPSTHDGLVDEGELEDWLCEISNLLIGAVKAELLRRNCILSIGLPHCSNDEDLEREVPDGYSHATYHFTVAHECVEALVSLNFFEEQIQCSEQSSNDEETERSELELF